MCQATSPKGRGSAVARPRWGLLYAVTLSQLAALGAVEAVHSPNPVRLTVRFLLALGMFATMCVWLRVNRPALDLQDWCDCAAERMSIRVVESAHPKPASLPAEWPLEPVPVDEDFETATR